MVYDLRRLIFAGKQMLDEKTAKDFNIEGGSVLHLVSHQILHKFSFQDLFSGSESEAHLRHKRGA